MVSDTPWRSEGPTGLLLFLPMPANKRLACLLLLEVMQEKEEQMRESWYISVRKMVVTFVHPYLSRYLYLWGLDPYWPKITTLMNICTQWYQSNKFYETLTNLGVVLCWYQIYHINHSHQIILKYWWKMVILRQNWCRKVPSDGWSKRWWIWLNIYFLVA